VNFCFRDLPGPVINVLMVERHFLGWERPFLGLLVDWLLARRDELPGMLVVVPTAQSGRRLREALAERGGCLTPKVVTPGFFLKTEGAAPEAVEVLAWVEVLEAISDWSDFEAVFPMPPGEDEGPGWSLGLARSLTGVRSGLQENALTLATAARRLFNTPEAERWSALQILETRVEARLSEWGQVSRSSLLEGLSREPVEGRIILAGVPDFPAAVASRLWVSDVTCLIGAPEACAEDFDELGRPVEDLWTIREIGWPNEGKGSVTLTADPRQQASEALRRAALRQTPSDGLTLGSADEETAGELVRAFGRAGWVLHDPAQLPAQPVVAWLRAWRAFVTRPDSAAAIDLLGFAKTAALVGGRRAQRVAALSSASDRWLSKNCEDLGRALLLTKREPEKEAISLAIETLELLEHLRGIFLREGFLKGLGRLLDSIDPLATETESVREWLEEMSPIASKVKREPGFWIDLLLATLPEPVPTPPENRVLDVQGWLELFHEPAAHLILCGLNEGKVPGRASTDAWLPEGTRRLLGLSTDASRAARDAYLLTALIESRRADGCVDLLLAKSGAGGDSLLPSRLLLATSESELPERVKVLFRELEPPDSSLAWTLEEAWKWKPKSVEVEPRLSVTAFSDYLACPFRFYLKHVVGMSGAEPERVEWNARDYGNIAHAVLERWALDEEAREFSKTEAIESWVHAELDRVVAERFGEQIPLAVRIQTESLRQRLSWFSRVQACERASGWRIDEVEKKFEMEVDGFIIAGKIDRIERHDDGRRRVLDYKTSAKAVQVEAAHRVEMKANTRLPAHLKDVSEVLCTTSEGKEKRWKNLQVAMYSVALGDIDELGYFALGATEVDVKISVWDGFSNADATSALDCARWVVHQAQAKVFWPPAERVDYDDYSVLSLGRSLEETVGMGGAA